MLTRDNFEIVIKSTFKGLEEELQENLYNNEYVQISMSSYGQTWIGGFMNDLPYNYEEIISDGTTYFLDVEEICQIMKVK